MGQFAELFVDLAVWLAHYCCEEVELKLISAWLLVDQGTLEPEVSVCIDDGRWEELPELVLVFKGSHEDLVDGKGELSSGFWLKLVLFLLFL